MKIGPKYKICRRLGEGVFPQCGTTKFSISGSSQRGPKTGRRRRGPSEYGRQLLEKQKARYTYGISENQFSNYVKKHHQPATLFSALESRLDNVVFRSGLALSRLAARQTVNHGHIMVNGRRLSIPSYLVKVGDKITIRSQSLGKGIFQDLDERLKDYTVPGWIENSSKGEYSILAQPLTGEAELNLDFPSIIDFYSRV